MRLRFSLRTLFALMTICALVCTWAVLPTLEAKRFLNALATREYAGADRFFCNPSDQFLTTYADKYWAFGATGELAPLTPGQLLRGERRVAVQLRYFYLDQNANGTAMICATGRGFGTPEFLPPVYNGIFIYSMPTPQIR